MSVPPESVVPPPPSEPIGGDIPAEERTWAMFAHLSALLGALLTTSLGALNFNITVAIATLVLLVLSAITFGIGLIIAIPLWVIIGVAWLVLTIIAGIKANEGVRYRYPFALRLIK